MANSECGVGVRVARAWIDGLALLLSLAAHLLVGLCIVNALYADKLPGEVLVAQNVRVRLLAAANAGASKAKPAPAQTSEASAEDVPDVTKPVAEPPPPEAPKAAQTIEAYYFPSVYLEVKPQVVIDAKFDLSAPLPPGSNSTFVLVLLINEYGDVDQIQFDDANLSDEIQQMIRKAFAQAKFQAGKIGDKPVKSQIKISVSLEKDAKADQDSLKRRR